MNNREFKFRVWSTLTERWLKDIEWIGINNRGVVVNDRNNADDLSLYTEATIQQYTGLKDKNGKEIYEGDIVKSSRCHTKKVKIGTNSLKYELIEDGIEIGEVVWISNRWSVSFEHIRHDDFDDLHVGHRQEIIGNICETPELLSKI